MRDQDRNTGKGNAGPDQLVNTPGGDRPQDHPIGPTSLQGLEASELPDGGLGDVDTDPRKLNARKLPANTGGTIGGDVGLRATPGAADADDHGHRKHN